eukprot:Rmarinus@m.9128
MVAIIASLAAALCFTAFAKAALPTCSSGEYICDTEQRSRFFQCVHREWVTQCAPEGTRCEPGQPSISFVELQHPEEYECDGSDFYLQRTGRVATWAVGGSGLGSGSAPDLSITFGTSGNLFGSGVPEGSATSTWTVSIDVGYSDSSFTAPITTTTSHKTPTPSPSPSLSPSPSYPSPSPPPSPSSLLSPSPSPPSTTSHATKGPGITVGGPCGPGLMTCSADRISEFHMCGASGLWLPAMCTAAGTRCEIVSEGVVAMAALEPNMDYDCGRKYVE